MNQRYSFYDIKYSGFNLIFEKVNFSLLKKKNWIKNWVKWKVKIKKHKKRDENFYHNLSSQII